MPPDDHPPQLPSIWTPALVTAIAGGVAAIIAALTGMLISLQGLRQDAQDSAKQQQIIIQKADQIHELANSNLGKVSTKLDVANAKIEGLEKIVRTNAADKKVADDLAARAVVP